MRVRSYIPPLFVAPSRRLLDALAAFEAPPVDEAEKNNMPLEWNEKGGGDARGYALVGEEEDVGQEHRGEEARQRKEDHSFPPGEASGRRFRTSEESSDEDDEEQEMLHSLRVPVPTSRYALSRRAVLVLALLLLFILFALSSNSLIPPRIPPPTRVGPRTTSGLYHGRGCNSTQLLASLESARIREDGASRTKFAKELSAEFDLSDFEFSYDLPNCPPPHIFTPAEACDLISSFGGIFLRGDSLMRHLAQTFLFFLSDSLDVHWDHKSECLSENAFSNGPFCRFYSYFDSADLPKMVCESMPYVKYEQTWTFETMAEGDWTPSNKTAGQYTNFTTSLPEERQQYSPVYISAHGIHYHFEAEQTRKYHVKPWITGTNDSIPRPLALWSGYMAPGPNKPVAWLEAQGPEIVQKYNKAMKEVFEEESEGEVWEGAWRSLEWYGVTEGASSFDGTHYSYQVNFERTIVILNLLDTLWGEIVDHGGLVAPEGQSWLSRAWSRGAVQ